MGPELPDTLKNNPILAVDGGAHFVSNLDIWVGDADSYKETIKTPHQYRHPPAKDSSDLALALDLFKDYGPYKFHFWGFLGARKDHELFNLGEALHFLEDHPESQILFYGKNGEISFHLVGSGDWKFSRSGLFSLGTLKKTKVKLIGNCTYPISQTSNLLPLSSLGLSNVGAGEMILKTEGPVFIHYPEDI